MNLHIQPTHSANASYASAPSMPVIEMDGPVLVFGGNYSNLEATEAILREAARLGIPPWRTICTGDVVAYCADALATVQLMQASGVHIIMGNCEESLGFDAVDCGCGFAEGTACDRLSEAWYAHADAELDDSSRTWMRELPRRIDIEIAGLRLAVVHGTVDRINRFIFASEHDDEFKRQFDLAQCNGVIAGHCGLPFTRTIGDRVWHNAGAIGMPANDGATRTWYTLIVPTDTGLEFRHMPLAFDHTRTAEKMQAAGLPQGYVDALSTGLWPSCDVLPSAEREERGRPLQEQVVLWKSETQRQHNAKFTDPAITANGETRAVVPLIKLKTLWLNTGTLCNLACENCYMESSPRNDRLEYLTRMEAKEFMAEASVFHPSMEEIGFTGGEPFMNPDVLIMMEDALKFGFRVLVLTNAMKPMQRLNSLLLDLHQRYPGRITLRVSIDHHLPQKHEFMRGENSWQSAVDGLRWLAENDFDVAVAGRMCWSESEADLRRGFQRRFSELDVSLDAHDSARLVLFPEMDDGSDVPEITDKCWSILKVAPESVMCASSRMVVRRKDAPRASVVACTLLPYDKRFELGARLGDALGPVSLNHRHCAKFCILGGASCNPHAS